MSRYNFFTKVRSYPAKSGECSANYMIQILLESVLKAHKNRLDVESRHDDCVLQGLIKNKCMETNITEYWKNSQEREENEQLKPKYGIRRMILKQGDLILFVVFYLLYYAR